MHGPATCWATAAVRLRAWTSVCSSEISAWTPSVNRSEGTSKASKPVHTQRHEGASLAVSQCWQRARVTSICLWTGSSNWTQAVDWPCVKQESVGLSVSRFSTDNWLLWHVCSCTFIHSPVITSSCHSSCQSIKQTRLRNRTRTQLRSTKSHFIIQCLICKDNIYTHSDTRGKQESVSTDPQSRSQSMFLWSVDHPCRWLSINTFDWLILWTNETMKYQRCNKDKKKHNKYTCILTDKILK